MAKIKGAAIVDSVRFLRRYKDEARKHLPPSLHRYLAERVMVASWYPEEDLVPLVRAMARIQGEPERSFFEKVGRLSAQAHAQGTYKHLVRAGERDSLPRRAFVLWSSQHDSGSMAMVGEEPGRISVVLKDFALPSRELCTINTGYVAATFEISGALGVKVDKQSCLVDGQPECRWLVTWDNR